MGFLNDSGVIEYGGIKILGKKGLENACTYPDFFRYWRDNLFERLMRLFIWEGTGSLEPKEIEERLYLAGHSGGEHPSLGRRYGPHARDDEFSREDHGNHDRRDLLKLDQQDQRRADKDLVRKRIHELAERRHQIVLARDVAVQKVREARCGKHRERNEVVVRENVLQHQQDNEHGDQ